MEFIKLFLNPEKFFRTLKEAYKYVLGLWIISILLGILSNYMVGSFYSYKMVFVSFAFFLPLLFFLKFLFISVFLKAFGSRCSLYEVVEKFFFLGYFYLLVFSILSILNDFVYIGYLVVPIFVCVIVHSVYALKGIYRIDGYRIVASYIILSTFSALIFLVLYVLSIAK